MKLFRNKNTEEMYISLTDSKDNLMDFNGNIITCSTEDYEEVNTKPKKQEFHRSNCTNCSRRKWYQIGYNDGFEAQPEKWVPVSSGKLPPDGEDVFVTYQDKDDPNERYIAITSYKERFFGTISIGKQWMPPFEYFNKNYEVVAWMPMFDEYKGV
jgi:hypothetical protein